MSYQSNQFFATIGYYGLVSNPSLFAKVTYEDKKYSYRLDSTIIRVYLCLSKDFWIARNQSASDSRERGRACSCLSFVFSTISLRFGSMRFIRNFDQLIPDT